MQRTLGWLEWLVRIGAVGGLIATGALWQQFKTARTELDALKPLHAEVRTLRETVRRMQTERGSVPISVEAVERLTCIESVIKQCQRSR